MSGFVFLSSFPVSISPFLLFDYFQMVRYTNRYHHEIGEFGLPAELTTFIQSFRPLNDTKPIDVATGFSKVVLSQLHALQNAYRAHWTRFDLVRMWLGACLMISSLLYLFCTRSCTSALYLFGQLGCTILVLQNKLLAWLQLPLVVLCPAVLLFRVILCCLSSLKSQWSWTPYRPLCLVLILSFVYWSNSFLVNELTVTQFLIQTLLLCKLAGQVKNMIRHDQGTKRVFGLYPPIPTILLSLLVRFSLNLEMCREESYPNSTCRPVTDPWFVKPLGKLSYAEAYSLASWRVLFAVSSLAGAAISVHVWLRRVDLLTSWNWTRMSIELIVPTGLFTLTVCWILDVAPVALSRGLQTVAVPSLFL